MAVFTIIVVSDTIYYSGKEDVSGERAKEIIESKGHKVSSKVIVPNDYKMIYKSVIEAVKNSDVVLVIGGTGPSPRDISIDVVEKLAWRKLPGFGELFRQLSYNEIGARAIISRAGLFIVEDSAVAVIPGSPHAVELALNKILMDVVDHLIEEIKRISGSHKI